jgi:hypothetical protein
MFDFVSIRFAVRVEGLVLFLNLWFGLNTIMILVWSFTCMRRTYCYEFVIVKRFDEGWFFCCTDFWHLGNPYHLLLSIMRAWQGKPRRAHSYIILIGATW